MPNLIKFLFFLMYDVATLGYGLTEYEIRLA